MRHYPTLLLLFTLPLLVPFQSRASNTDNGQLAQKMTKLLGVNVSPQQVDIYDFWQLRSWIGIPPFMVDRVRNRQYKKFIFIRIPFNERFREVILESPPPIRQAFTADFIIVTNSNSEEEDFKRCNVNVCLTDGGCQKVDIIANFCWDECQSASDCAQPCFIFRCENGLCVPSYEYLTNCPPPGAECTEDSNCANEGTNTSCVVNTCLMEGICWPIHVQINDEIEQCPDDECESDDDCVTSLDGGEGGDILNKLEEILEM